MAITSINPYNGETIAEYTENTPQELEQIIRRANDAFQKWQHEPVSVRAGYLAKVADLLETRSEEASEIITNEMGKLLGESRAEIKLTISILRYYAEHSEHFLQDQEVESPIGKATVQYRPIGVILGIEPWNFPFYQIVRMAAPNIACGNTVIMKQASNVTGCALFFQKLFDDADVPNGVYNTIILSGSKTSDLLNNDRIAGVSLTGSEKAGAVVASVAAKNLKKSVMELGGSDALIVLDEVDLDKAVDLAMVARMSNAGQVCISSKRIILHKNIADGFMTRLNEKLSLLKPGNPLEKETSLAPVNTENALETLLDQVKRAVDNGATLVQGGKKIETDGFFMEPAVLTGITPENPLFYEEMFGPIVVYYIAENDDEAIKIANNSHYGLGGAVFSSNIERAKQVASKIEAGMVFINTPTISAPELPFGGIKRSGYGRELSGDGLHEFVNKKLINVNETGNFGPVFSV
ncbi:MAG: NAD-dependent succinate-semialdehyde dehydrogenase [Chitinophagaceae bacterium]|nr:NAD-dependent succinate-semialdehyde dehydrogenase [Chitinophagaceae bacterium]